MKTIKETEADLDILAFPILLIAIIVFIIVTPFRKINQQLHKLSK